jgi:hypothetical protein
VLNGRQWPGEWLENTGGRLSELDFMPYTRRVPPTATLRACGGRGGTRAGEYAPEARTRAAGTSTRPETAARRPTQRLSLQPAPAELLAFGLHKLCLHSCKGKSGSYPDISTLTAAYSLIDTGVPGYCDIFILVEPPSQLNSNPLTEAARKAAAGALLVTCDLMARTAVAC